MEKINVVKQVQELKNALAYSKRIGFFFGAGTSCAFGLPNIVALSTAVIAGLEPDERAYFQQIQESVKQLTGNSSATVEDVLNYIRQIRDITRERPDKQYDGISGQLALQLDTHICQAIFNAIITAEASADITLMKKFFAWLDSLDSNSTKEVFTTNYDMLFEKALEQNNIPYFDGFVGAYEPFFHPECIEQSIHTSDVTYRWVRLWKIHGSLNWQGKPSAADGAKRIIRIGKTDKPVDEMMIYPTREKYNLSRKQPYVAYFDHLKEYLLSSETIFMISGYSFNDQHVNDVLLSCLRQNPRLCIFVFCYSDEQVSAMESYGTLYMNLFVFGPKKVITRGQCLNWVLDDTAGYDAKDKDQYWDTSSSSFFLGDFSKLVKFLIENSGNQALIEGDKHGK